jgi:serine/threonine protein kinase
MGCCGGDASLAVGKEEGNKFDIMRSKWDVEPHAIGEGGFGSVHLCRSKKDGKQRAIKAMKLNNSLDREDFQNEFAIMQKIKKHRNICHILDGGSDPRYGYLVMQSCTGGELFDRIASKDMTEKDAAIAVGDIIAALRFIHAKRVIHRDLKPENVLYKDKEPGSPLKLIDFGLAIYLPVRTESTAAGVIPGSPRGRLSVSCARLVGISVLFAVPLNLSLPPSPSHLTLG